jgi:hypothetical protein
VPVSYLGGLTERIQADELTYAEQSALLMEVRRALGDPDTRADALTLAAKFRKRRDLLAVIGDDLDDLLGRRGGGSESGAGRAPLVRQPVSRTQVPPADRGPTGTRTGGSSHGRPLGVRGPGEQQATGGYDGPEEDSGILSGPTEKRAFLLQIFLGAGLFVLAPEARRRWIYPAAVLLGLWGLSLAPNGLDLDLGGQLDTELDGPASFLAVVGGLAYAAGIVDLFLILARRKNE